MPPTSEIHVSQAGLKPLQCTRVPAGISDNEVTDDGECGVRRGHGVVLSGFESYHMHLSPFVHKKAREMAGENIYIIWCFHRMRLQAVSVRKKSRWCGGGQCTCIIDSVPPADGIMEHRKGTLKQTRICINPASLLLSRLPP